MTTPRTCPPEPDQVDPEDPEAFIAAAIFWYPNLFENRTDVLDHLLFSAGNGYEWDPQGRIVSVFRDRGRRTPLSPDAATAMWQLPADADEATRDRWAAQAAHRRQVQAEHATRARTHGPVLVDALPDRRGRNRDYMLAFALPDRVHPEWAKILEEGLTLFQAAWAAQEAAEQARCAELDADECVNAARLLHPLLDAAYVANRVSEAEHRDARKTLEAHAAPVADLADLDEAREERARLTNETYGSLADLYGDEPRVWAPLDSTRMDSTTLFAVVDDALAEVARGGRVPVPDTTWAELVWLRDAAGCFFPF